MLVWLSQISVALRPHRTRNFSITVLTVTSSARDSNQSKTTQHHDFSSISLPEFICQTVLEIIRASVFCWKRMSTPGWLWVRVGLPTANAFYDWNADNSRKLILQIAWGDSAYFCASFDIIWGCWWEQWNCYVAKTEAARVLRCLRPWGTHPNSQLWGPRRAAHQRKGGTIPWCVRYLTVCFSSHSEFLVPNLNECASSLGKLMGREEC